MVPYLVRKTASLGSRCDTQVTVYGVEYWVHWHVDGVQAPQGCSYHRSVSISSTWSELHRSPQFQFQFQFEFVFFLRKSPVRNMEVMTNPKSAGTTSHPIRRKCTHAISGRAKLNLNPGDVGHDWLEGSRNGEVLCTTSARHRRAGSVGTLYDFHHLLESDCASLQPPTSQVDDMVAVNPSAGSSVRSPIDLDLMTSARISYLVSRCCTPYRVYLQTASVGIPVPSFHRPPATAARRSLIPPPHSSPVMPQGVPLPPE